MNRFSATPGSVKQSWAIPLFRISAWGSICITAVAFMLLALGGALNLVTVTQPISKTWDPSHLYWVTISWALAHLIGSYSAIANTKIPSFWHTMNAGFGIWATEFVAIFLICLPILYVLPTAFFLALSIPQMMMQFGAVMGIEDFFATLNDYLSGTTLDEILSDRQIATNVFWWVFGVTGLSLLTSLLGAWLAWQIGKRAQRTAHNQATLNLSKKSEVKISEQLSTTQTPSGSESIREAS